MQTKNNLLRKLRSPWTKAQNVLNGNTRDFGDLLWILSARLMAHLERTRAQLTGWASAVRKVRNTASLACTILEGTF